MEDTELSQHDSSEDDDKLGLKRKRRSDHLGEKDDALNRQKAKIFERLLSLCVQQFIDNGIVSIASNIYSNSTRSNSGKNHEKMFDMQVRLQHYSLSYKNKKERLQQAEKNAVDIKRSFSAELWTKDRACEILQKQLNEKTLEMQKMVDMKERACVDLMKQLDQKNLEMQKMIDVQLCYSNTIQSTRAERDHAQRERSVLEQKLVKAEQLQSQLGGQLGALYDEYKKLEERFGEKKIQLDQAEKKDERDRDLTASKQLINELEGKLLAQKAELEQSAAEKEGLRARAERAEKAEKMLREKAGLFALNLEAKISSAEHYCYLNQAIDRANEFVEKKRQLDSIIESFKKKHSAAQEHQ